MEITKDHKAHTLQHDGKKPHSCNQCGYSSISAANLKIHMLVHSGEKPFICKQCNYSYIRLQLQLARVRPLTLLLSMLNTPHSPLKTP